MNVFPGVHGGCQCRGIVSPPTTPRHRHDVNIHGLILAWGVGHRLSNPSKIGPELKRLGWDEAALGAGFKSDPGKLALAARLHRETTETLRWNVARLQAGSWKSLAAKLHRWRKTHDSPDNESRLQFDLL